MVDDAGVHSSQGSPWVLSHKITGDAVIMGMVMVLPGSRPTLARVDFLCNDDGFLVRFIPEGNQEARATCWAVPRLLLDETLFDGYTYWRSADDESRSGRIADLGDPEAFARQSVLRRR